MLGDREVMLVQVEELANPIRFTPGLGSQHRPPMKQDIYGTQEKGQSKSKG